MQLPSLSIITPSYNHAEFIEATLQSVVSQRYPALEYLVMDGGSSDGTVDILRRYEPQLRYVSERDGGQTHALNRAFGRVAGELIGWLNSDDVYEPGALELVGRTFAEHPEVDWIFGRCPIIDKDGRPYKAYVTAYKEWWMRRYSYARYLVVNFVCQPAVFFRRRLLDEVGAIDTELHNAFDYDLFLRMAARSEPLFIDRALANFRVHGQAKSSLHYRRGFREEVIAARRVSQGQRPLLIFLHELNRIQMTAAYQLMDRLSI